MTEKVTKAVALICHGLNTNPEKMKPLKKFLESKGVETYQLTLSGHQGSVEQMKGVSADLWLEDLKKAYEKVRARSEALGVPFYYLGYSLGGLLNAVFLEENKEAHYDKMILFAPALSLRMSSHLARFFKLFRKRFIVPSFSPKLYQYHNGITVASYVALFELIDRLKHKSFSALNFPTLVFIDPGDELVSARGIKRLIEKRELSHWKFYPLRKDKKTAQLRFRHLILDEYTLGEKTWKEVQDQIKEFLF